MEQHIILSYVPTLTLNPVSSGKHAFGVIDQDYSTLITMYPEHLGNRSFTLTVASPSYVRTVNEHDRIAQIACQCFSHHGLPNADVAMKEKPPNTFSNLLSELMLNDTADLVEG